MKKLLICFDVDGTLIDDTIFIWQTLHDAIGTDPVEREEWAQSFWDKKITYSQWAGHDIEMWRREGVTKSELFNHINALTPMNGALQTLEKLKAAGHVLGVISGSLDIALEQAFPQCVSLFSHIFLNRLEFDDEDRLTGIIPTPFDIDHKADGLIEMTRRTGISIENTVFVGDHFNDVSVARIAGLSFAFNCKSQDLASVSDHVIKDLDMRKIIPLIEEFARIDQAELNSAIS